MTTPIIGTERVTAWWGTEGRHGTWLRDDLEPALDAATVGHERYMDLDGSRTVVLARGGDAVAPGLPDDAVQAAGYRRTTPERLEAAVTPFLFMVSVTTPDPWGEPLREWLHGEHFTHQLKTPGVEWSCGYEAVVPGEGQVQFLNLWGLSAADAPSTEAYATVRDTPWYARVAPAFAASVVDRSVFRLA
jgi:hypothetical protein